MNKKDNNFKIWCIKVLGITFILVVVNVLAIYGLVKLFNTLIA
jgi:hypothetical protein